MSAARSLLKVRVARKQVEAVDIRSFELVSAEGQALPPFSAGSHIDVVVSPELTRQYSLCNSPIDSHSYLIAVLRDPNTRGGSAGMHDRIGEGDVIEISAPKNHFELAPAADKHLLLAGGIGVTPILCMAERLAVTGAQFEMHYCTRAKDRAAFHERISSAPFADKVQFHFDSGSPDQKFDIAARLGTPEPGTHVYVCGPRGFMTAVLDAARASGWPESQLHYEFFAADAGPSGSDESFEVQLGSSGRVLLVPKDKTVIQALEEAGVAVPVSCEQGVCGTCVTRVLAGVPDHKDVFLTPEEQAANDQFTPCCSRSRTPRLVLDL